MNVLRRGGAGLLLVCSALGVALCLGALVGVWIVRQPAKEVIGDTLDTVDSYLTLANQTVEEVGDRTARLWATLDGARRELVAGGDAGRGAMTARVAVAVQETSATLTTLRSVVQTLSTSVATVNRTLGHLRLPGVVPPTLPDDLQGLERGLSTLGDHLDTLGAAVSDVGLGVTSLTDRLGAVSVELQALNDRLDQWKSRLAAARSAMGSAKAAVSTAIDLASVGLSLLLVLFGAGQASLCIQAWRWLRTPSVQGS
jgi:uncharacterized protein YoxC